MTLSEYANRYQTIQFERKDGILQMTLHTDGDSLRWGSKPCQEMAGAFGDISRDAANRVVIITGTGLEFNGPKCTPDMFPQVSPRGWDGAHWWDRQLLTNLLSIEAPVISAINGPVWRHCEMPLLSDVIIASDTTVFQDSGHFINGLVPGDGMHLVTQLVMGLNRARYFMLLGQEIGAEQALTMGIVNEVVPQAHVLDRAWEVARLIAQQPPLVTTYTRLCFVHHIRQFLSAYQGYGLMLEGMAAMDDVDRRPGYPLESRI